MFMNNKVQILDNFVEAGYEDYQSIQVSSGLNNAEIKKKYGGRLTMWTGVQCETLMPGGGFIFGSANSVQFGANSDNYRMALDIVREKGRY